MIINILLPHYGYKPAGGFKIAYIYANEFSKRGHRVNLIHAAFCKKGIRKNLFAAIETWLGKKEAVEWFDFEPGINRIYTTSLHEKNIPEADVTIATAYETSIFLNKYSCSKGKKIYLIQDLEVWADDEDTVLSTWKYEMSKIVISKYLLDIGRKNGISNIFYIPNALDTNIYGVFKDYKMRKNCIAMMYSSVERKGAKFGIEVLIEVKKTIPEIQIILFGKEKRPVDLPEWMNYYNNPKQDFIIQNIYNNASIFLCTSIYEGWGLPPMEAMACGAAVVTTDCGGVRDFAISGKTALVCPVKNVEVIKESILSLLENESMRIMLIRNGLEKIKEFDWGKNTERFLEIIEGV